MSDERTLVMSNARPSVPSVIAFDDGALNDLEAAARLVGTSVAGQTASRLAPSLGHVGSRPSMSAGPRRAGASTTGPNVAALVAGGLVAVATAATVAFHFLVS